MSLKLYKAAGLSGRTATGIPGRIAAGVPGRIASILTAVMAAAALMLSLVPCEAMAATDIGTVYVGTALLGDLESGAVFFTQDADEVIIPASTTKVLTAMLIVEAIERGELDVDEKVMATQAIIDGVIYDASRVLPYIEDGEELTVKEYLYCIMLGSDCVACDILADRVSGSVEGFVELMNQRASELGCTDTNFVNTHGYPTEGHYTTARSLFLIMRQAMNYDLFREIISTIKIELPKTEQGKESRKLYNTDWMIWNPEKITSMYTVNYYPYAIGGKTGSSKASGHCLVSCAQKDGVTLVAVVTGGANEIAQESGQWTNRSFSESRKLFEWGFENYSRFTLMTSGSDAGAVAVNGGQDDRVSVRAAGEVTAVLPKDEPVDSEKLSTVYPSSPVQAPVSAGDAVGQMQVYYDGVLRGQVELIAANDVQARPVSRQDEQQDNDNEKKKNSAGKTLTVLILMTLVLFGGALFLYVTNNKKIIIQDYYNGSGAPQITRRAAEFFSGMTSGASSGGGNSQPQARTKTTNGIQAARRQPSGTQQGTAVRRQSSGTQQGTAVRRQPSGTQQGTAVRRQPSGAQQGTAVRRQSSGTQQGTAVRRQSSGTADGVSSYGTRVAQNRQAQQRQSSGQRTAQRTGSAQPQRQRTGGTANRPEGDGRQ